MKWLLLNVYLEYRQQLSLSLSLSLSTLSVELKVTEARRSVLCRAWTHYLSNVAPQTILTVHRQSSDLRPRFWSRIQELISVVALCLVFSGPISNPKGPRANQIPKRASSVCLFIHRHRDDVGCCSLAPPSVVYRCNGGHLVVCTSTLLPISQCRVVIILKHISCVHVCVCACECLYCILMQ